MAILKKEDYFAKIKARIGDDMGDEALSFIEDMTDTYNDLESKSNGDSEDWKTKYDELDKSWRDKYRARFFEGEAGTNANEVKENQQEDIIKDGEETTFEDLFTEKE